MVCSKCSQDIKTQIEHNGPAGTYFDGCNCAYDNTGRVVTGREDMGNANYLTPCQCSNVGRVLLGHGPYGRNALPVNQQTYIYKNQYSNQPVQAPSPEYIPPPTFTPAPQQAAFDTGSFVVGAIIGGVVIALLVTATGRSIVTAAGKRVEGFLRDY